jgi:hypothetical protein
MEGGDQFAGLGAIEPVTHADRAFATLVRCAGTSLAVEHARYHINTADLRVSHSFIHVLTTGPPQSSVKGHFYRGAIGPLS